MYPHQHPLGLGRSDLAGRLLHNMHQCLPLLRLLMCPSCAVSAVQCKVEVCDRITLHAECLYSFSYSLQL